ncbi:hypothetical protein [Pseudomonas putida]|nr:hypothetical protein [Pseudomonas putida]MDG9816836.1 hypothetical protein [Pseudomonas putida]
MAAITDGSEHIAHKHLDNIEYIMDDLCIALRDVDQLEREGGFA